MKSITYVDKYCGRQRRLQPSSSAFWWCLAFLVVSIFVLRTWIVVPASANVPTTPRTADEQSGIRACVNDLIQYHDPGLVSVVQPPRQVTCFSKYISNFDLRREGQDADDQRPLAIPRWVIQRVDANTNAAAEASRRPATWFSIPDLVKDRLAPTDNSYRFSFAFRSTHLNWYERGHLAQKYLAERAPADPLLTDNPSVTDGAGSGWFTHNLANAVPQRGRFNKGPWLTLECYTGAWANKYKSVWILTGPIFLQGHPTEWLTTDASPKAVAVAVPEALFKVVFRQDSNRDWQTLAFIYPQDSETYLKGPWDPVHWLTSIEQVQKLTGIDIFPSGVAFKDPAGETAIPSKLWPVTRDDFDRSCRRFAPGTT